MLFRSHLLPSRHWDPLHHLQQHRVCHPRLPHHCKWLVVAVYSDRAPNSNYRFLHRSRRFLTVLLVFQPRRQYLRPRSRLQVRQESLNPRVEGRPAAAESWPRSVCPPLSKAERLGKTMAAARPLVSHLCDLHADADVGLNRSFCQSRQGGPKHRH